MTGGAKKGPLGSPQSARAPRFGWASPVANAGVYLVSREVVEACSPSCSLERDVLPGMVDRGRVRAIVRSGYFIDIGVPETFAIAQTAVPHQQRRPAVFLGLGGLLDPTDDRLCWRNGAQAAIRTLNDAGSYVFLAAGQTGTVSETDAQALHRRLARDLAAVGAHVDDVHPGFGPAMWLDLAARWPLDAAGSVMICDTEPEVQAARAAGLPGVLFPGEDRAGFTANDV